MECRQGPLLSFLLVEFNLVYNFVVGRYLYIKNTGIPMARDAGMPYNQIAAYSKEEINRWKNPTR